MQQITNISAYHFTPMQNLKELRHDLLEFAKTRSLKGTILLAPEGINMFIAGPREKVDELVDRIRELPGLDSLNPKYSDSDHQPFTRMLVRLKKEIIAFGVEGIDPGHYTAPRIKPRELKQWLDEGRPVVLYDTRNDYEVKLGTFKGAIAAGIDHFRNFPDAVEQLPEEYKDAPVVTFCTGGIRCEKAAPFMEREGFKNVYQLDGGILKYFEEVGSDHYDGECFVFDHRVGVDPALRESGSVICFVCQAPLTAEETEDTRYVEGESCPYCYVSDETKKAARVAESQARLDALMNPLPGSRPYENHKPIRIPASLAGKTIIEVLDTLFPFVEHEEWLSRIDQEHILAPDKLPVETSHIVKEGEQYQRVMPHTQEPDVNAGIRVIDEDESMIVLEKPAPLPMHACGRYNRNTLEYFIRQAWSPLMPRPAHRLDANTTGLVVCSRSRHFARLLQPQFAKGDVEKTYLAKVIGHPDKDEFIIDDRIASKAVKLGAREIDHEEGQEAVTVVKVVKRKDDGTALLHVFPQTGRTNQIRIHLWQAGLPIVGDPVYLPDKNRGDKQTLSIDDKPMCLHAWKLTFKHPLTGDEVNYEASVPLWFT